MDFIQQTQKMRVKVSNQGLRHCFQDTRMDVGRSGSKEEAMREGGRANGLLRVHGTNLAARVGLPPPEIRAPLTAQGSVRTFAFVYQPRVASFFDARRPEWPRGRQGVASASLPGGECEPGAWFKEEVGGPFREESEDPGAQSATLGLDAFCVCSRPRGVVGGPHNGSARSRYRVFQ